MSSFSQRLKEYASSEKPVVKEMSSADRERDRYHDRRYDDRRYDDRRYDDRRYDDRRYDDRRYEDRRYDDRRYDDRRYDDRRYDDRRGDRYDDRRGSRYDDRHRDDYRREYENEPFKIAFLFLVRDDINYPDIWENYFKGNEDKISIYCHPKNPENVKTEWLRTNIIPNLVETAWGQITDAYFTLINKALQNKENKKFVIVTESCLPLKTFDQLYNFFDSSDIRTSYIKFWYLKRYDIGARLKDRTSFVNIQGKTIPFIKHYSRFCLSRYHALKLLNYTEDTDITDTYVHNKDLDMFNNIEVGDEFFLSLLEARKGEDYIMDYEITYDNWKRVPIERENIERRIQQLQEEQKKASTTKIEHILEEINKLKSRLRELTGANPYAYYEVNAQDIRMALRKESFFWRKFPKESNIREYYSSEGVPMIRGGKKRKTKVKKMKTTNKTNKRKYNKRRTFKIYKN